MSRTEQKHGWHLDDAEDALDRVIDILRRRSYGVAAAGVATTELEAARASLQSARKRPKGERRVDVGAALERLRIVAAHVHDHADRIGDANTVVSVLRIVIGGLGATFPPKSDAPRKSTVLPGVAAATTKRPMAGGKQTKTAPPTKRPLARAEQEPSAPRGARAVRSAKRTLPMGAVDGRAKPDDAD